VEFLSGIHAPWPAAPLTNERHDAEVLDVTVPAGGRLNAGQLHLSLRASRDPAVLRLDLRAAAWVEPIGLVMLAALAERQAAEGERVSLRGPASPNIARYLARMRLGTVLDALGQEHDLPPVREWDTGELVELRRFSGEDEPDELGKMVFAKTSADLRVARALHQSIAELGTNVPEHAGVRHGYVAAQTTYNGTVVQFAVGDAGVGVAAGFASKPTDAQALQDVLTGVSRRPERGRGRGLAKTQKLVIGLGGSLHMLSGTAHRTHAGHGRTYGGATSLYPGTLLQGTFPVP
jgi:hypothetical protein